MERRTQIAWSAVVLHLREETVEVKRDAVRGAVREHRRQPAPPHMPPLSAHEFVASSACGRRGGRRMKRYLARDGARLLDDLVLGCAGRRGAADARDLEGGGQGSEAPSQSPATDWK